MHENALVVGAVAPGLVHAEFAPHGVFFGGGGHGGRDAVDEYLVGRVSGGVLGGGGVGAYGEGGERGADYTEEAFNCRPGKCLTSEPWEVENVSEVSFER